MAGWDEIIIPNEYHIVDLCISRLNRFNNQKDKAVRDEIHIRSLFHNLGFNFRQRRVGGSLINLTSGTVIVCYFRNENTAR